MRACAPELAKHGVQGPAHEIRYVVQPWDFDVAAIKQPVTFWRGQRDGHAPVVLAEKLMAAFPHATIHRILDKGHTIFYTNWRQIAQQLANDIALRRDTDAQHSSDPYTAMKLIVDHARTSSEATKRRN
jgi:pimeloyl-ACP methyl ester carboxylesterase